MTSSTVAITAASSMAEAELTESLTGALGISPLALSMPDIDSYTGLMHTLFALEDLYGFKIDRLDGEICIRINRQNGSTAMGRSAVRSMTSGDTGIRGRRRREMKRLVKAIIICK